MGCGVGKGDLGTSTQVEHATNSRLRHLQGRVLNKGKAIIVPGASVWLPDLCSVAALIRLAISPFESLMKVRYKFLQS